MGSVIRTNTSRNEKWDWRTFGWQEINKWNYSLNLHPVNSDSFHSFFPDSSYLYNHEGCLQPGSSREVYTCHTGFPPRLVGSHRSPETKDKESKGLLRLLATVQSQVYNQIDGNQPQAVAYSTTVSVFILSNIGHVLKQGWKKAFLFKMKGSLFSFAFNCIYISEEKTLPFKKTFEQGAAVLSVIWGNVNPRPERWI